MAEALAAELVRADALDAQDRVAGEAARGGHLHARDVRDDDVGLLGPDGLLLDAFGGDVPLGPHERALAVLPVGRVGDGAELSEGAVLEPAAATAGVGWSDELVEEGKSGEVVGECDDQHVCVLTGGLGLFVSQGPINIPKDTHGTLALPFLNCNDLLISGYSPEACSL